jgi:hypothetical protein
MAEDYYKILELEKTATEAEIKRAYRKLAHQYHPDKGGGNEETNMTSSDILLIINQLLDNKARGLAASTFLVLAGSKELNLIFQTWVIFLMFFSAAKAGRAKLAAATLKDALK